MRHTCKSSAWHIGGQLMPATIINRLFGKLLNSVDSKSSVLPKHAFSAALSREGKKPPYIDHQLCAGHEVPLRSNLISFLVTKTLIFAHVEPEAQRG